MMVNIWCLKLLIIINCLHFLKIVDPRHMKKQDLISQLFLKIQGHRYQDAGKFCIAANSERYKKKTVATLKDTAVNWKLNTFEKFREKFYRMINAAKVDSFC